MASNFAKILITTGDVDGIGWEVTAKALHDLGPQKNTQFIFFRHARATHLKPALSKRFKNVVTTSLAEASDIPFSPNVLIEVRNADNPAAWVEQAAAACRDGLFHAMVTAPLSKTSIIESGLKDIGHTEILARVCKTPDLFMGFLGEKFSVVLVTGHSPLKEAVRTFSEARLLEAVRAAQRMRSLLPKGRRKLPMALVGVNPHAGESGLLGTEELWMRQALTSWREDFGDIAGPLVPDAAFLPLNWKSYSIYLCPYHDQGLIPFKLVHGFKGGVHLTLGLPFVRTSVDHGTAKELFGKNKAEAGSMKDAILTAARLCSER